MQRYFILFFLFWGASTLLPAQNVLSLEDAVAEAMQNNYDVQVQRYNAQRSDLEAHPGGAGLLPSLSLGGNGQYSISNGTGNQLGRGESFDTTGVENISAGAQAQLSYTLALANFRNYKLLKRNASLSEQQTQQVIENTALQVINAYYNLAKLSNRLDIQRQSLARSRERLALVENQQAYGGGNRLAVLNARVNVNTDSVNLVSTQASYDNARRDLNLLMGRAIDSEYAVETEVSLSESLDLTTLIESLRTSNASLSVAEENRQLAELNLDVAQAGRYPTLSVDGSYDYNYQQNPLSFFPELQTWGPSISASVNFNLFNGFQTSRQIQSAEVNVASSRAQYKQAEQAALRDLAQAYANYQNNQRVLALNQANLEAARLNFTRTQEAFKLGQVSSVEFREAQLNLQQIENQLNDLRYDIKLNEVQLLQLSGQLVSQQELLLGR